MLLQASRARPHRPRARSVSCCRRQTQKLRGGMRWRRCWRHGASPKRCFIGNKPMVYRQCHTQKVCQFGTSGLSWQSRHAAAGSAVSGAAVSPNRSAFSDPCTAVFLVMHGALLAWCWSAVAVLQLQALCRCNPMKPACLTSITVPQRRIVPAVNNAHGNRALAASEETLEP